MAESVDALVSNTSGAIRAGSTPALGTSRELRRSAFALRTEAPYSRSFSPKISRFLGTPEGSGSAKCDRLAVGGALLSLLFPKTSCRAFGDPIKKSQWPTLTAKVKQ